MGKCEGNIMPVESALGADGLGPNRRYSWHFMAVLPTAMTF